MLLSEEQFDRGFIDFDAELPPGGMIKLFVKTRDANTGSESEWSGPHADQSGEILNSPAGSSFKLKIESERGPDPYRTTRLTKVRIDRTTGTFLWPGPAGFTGPPIVTRARDFGYSHRILFRPILHSFSVPFVIVSPTLRIRVTNTSTRGMVATADVTATQVTESSTELYADVRDEEFSGPLVELVATTPLNVAEHDGTQAAREMAESAAGLLGLTLGESFIDSVLHREDLKVEPAAATGTVQWEQKYAEPEYSLENIPTRHFESFQQLSQFDSSNALIFGLRWYLKGLTDVTQADAFLALFLGIDAIVSKWFSEIDPKPQRDEFIKLQRHFTQHGSDLSEAVRRAALSRLSDFPLTHKFVRYWQENIGEMTSESESFSRLNRLRARLAHGTPDPITDADLHDARMILSTLLANNLNVDASAGPIWPTRKLLLTLEYMLSPANISSVQ